jgi:hypothetical protein
MMFLAPTSPRDRDSLEVGGSKREWPNLTSHINTGLHGPSSVILRSSMTAIVEQVLYPRPQTLLFR